MNSELESAFKIFDDPCVDFEKFKQAASSLKFRGKRKINFTPREISSYVKLILKEQEEPGSVQISISSEKKYAFVTVLAPDWTGYLATVSGVIQGRGYNLSYLHAFLTKDEKYGVINMEINFPTQKEAEEFKHKTDELTSILKGMAREDEPLKRLLKDETRKLEKYRETIRILEKICRKGEVSALVREDGEAKQFFASRSSAYIRERRSEDLAEQILINFRFQQKVRKTGGVFIDLKNIETKKESLTALSIAGFDRYLSLDDTLQGLREFLPNFQRKFDKEFVTDDGIAVFRIEIQDEDGKQLKEEEFDELHLFLLNKLKKRRKRRSPLEFRAGAELFGRLIIPQLVKEASCSEKSQLYILPAVSTRDTAQFKIVLVSPIRDKKLGKIEYSCINRLNRVMGLSIASSKSPSSIQDNEVDVIDIIADTTVFDKTEDVYGVIKDCVEKVVGDFRDFDEGMRVADINKLNELVEIFKGKIPEKFIRKFYYGMEDFFRVSEPKEKLAKDVQWGWDTLLKFRKSKKRRYIKSESTEFSTRICVVEKGDTLGTEKYLKILSDYQFFLTRVDVPGAILLMFRVFEKNRPLSKEKLNAVMEKLR